MATRLRDVEEIPKFAENLIEWLAQGKFFSAESKFVEVVDNSEDRFKVRIYTSDHVYGIVCTPRCDDCKNGYLGGSASTRRRRAGETWNRGNDIADGPYAKETFNAIMLDIVGEESVEVEKDLTPAKYTASEAGNPGLPPPGALES